MFNWIRSQVLRLTRVPQDPEPPFGAPGSVQIFRAGRNYYRLRLFRWGAGQVGAMIGIVVSLTFLAWFKHDVAEVRSGSTQPPAPIPFLSDKPSTAKNKHQRFTRADLRALAARTPDWVVVAVEVLEFGGILIFILQIPVTFAAVRLEYELHWYIVTDRSLRIRTGLFQLTESTMSFANLQQVEVKQGPLQRLLGLADVHVQSAGGGGDNDKPHAGESLHTGIFHSVENASEIRDLIQNRLRQFREAGLGDFDDHGATASAPAAHETSVADTTTLAAVHEVLAEARALRASLS